MSFAFLIIRINNYLFFFFFSLSQQPEDQQTEELKAAKQTKRGASAQLTQDLIDENTEYVPKIQPTVTRKKSAFNRISEMIAKSPILEPLRSDNFYFFSSFLTSHPFLCVSIPFGYFLFTRFDTKYITNHNYYFTNQITHNNTISTNNTKTNTTNTNTINNNDKKQYQQ